MGKTVQAGVLLHEIHAREPDAATLVVAPPGLLSQWQTELATRVRLDASLLDADTLRREAAQPRAVVDAARRRHVLARVDGPAPPARRRRFAGTHEVDAAGGGRSALRRTGDSTSAAVARVASASVRVLLLTATPAASGPLAADELRQLGGRQAEAAMPVLRRAASLLARPPRRNCVLKVDLGAAHQALCRLLDAFVERARRESGARGLLPALVLRRRGCSCPAALRRSLERRLTVLGDPEPLQAPRLPGLLDAEPPLDPGCDRRRVDAGAGVGRRGGRAARPRASAGARSKPACRRPQARSRGEARPPLPSTRRHLHGVPRHVAGAATAAARRRARRRPRRATGRAACRRTRGLHDRQASVLLATDAAAEGLNLHARCRLVIHAEVPASARSLEQRNGRLDRYGQADACTPS